MSKVTIYEKYDSKTPHHITMSAALKRIKSSKENKERIEAVRSGKLDKKLLPAVVFAGIIEGEKRSDDNVTKHSGFFVCDWDKVDAGQKKAQLIQDSYIYACWVSPSGNGIKALVKCPPSIEKHELYYNAFLDRYPELDTTSRNISRLCFESYDPDIYINTKSITWSRAITEEERRSVVEKKQNKSSDRVLSVAVGMIRTSYDGTKHFKLRDAANLVGGYIATGALDEDATIKLLTEEIKHKEPASLKDAIKTLKDGIEYGKKRPLHEAKIIEKKQNYLKRDDGTYDFLADEQEMDEYEWAYINGTLQMGLPTGMPQLDRHWMFKEHTLTWVGGISNIGKSFLGWYKSILAAMLYGWPILMYTKENRDGQVRKKLKEFYIGKSIKLFNEEEHKLSKEFISKHFRQFSAKKMHTAEEFLLKCEIIYDEGFEYKLVVAEPYNAFDVPKGDAMYQSNTKVLNQMQTFKENYSSVLILDHVGSEAARKRDGEGYIQVPWKSDIEMGAMKDNKADDFMIYHRYSTDPTRKWITEVHVHKIKDVETGGEPTPKDEPVKLLANKDLCGYSCGGVDPVKEYWRKKSGGDSFSTLPPSPEWEEEEEETPF